ncbi:hypothetical protein Ancab_036040 [Ancistrocladus abbreviatus]
MGAPLGRQFYPSESQNKSRRQGRESKSRHPSPILPTLNQISRTRQICAIKIQVEAKFVLKMDRNQRPTSLIDTLGEEIIRIIAPVSTCMLLVVLLVAILNSDSSSSSSEPVTTIATIAYDWNSSDSFWDKLKGALLSSLVFVAVVTVVTFILVFLFYIRCTKFLKYYMGFSAFIVLVFMGGQISLLLVEHFSIPIDCITFLVILFNFSVVGVLAVCMTKMAIFVTQGYLVAIGMLVAYWFTLLPEWTTWALLVAMALYDLAAVLLPGGPLRLLVELAMSRDEDIPALVYEARPVNCDESSMGIGVGQRRWRTRTSSTDQNENHGSAVNSSEIPNDTLELNSNPNVLPSVESGQRDLELSAPLLEQRMNVNSHVEAAVVSDESLAFEGIGLGSSGSIKLGLGDFIFYSVLVGRAAMYDFMTVYACYLAIIAGLGVTLMLLAIYKKALPALPVSVMLGVLFYFLTRILLEEFVVQCSMNLLMF